MRRNIDQQISTQEESNETSEQSRRARLIKKYVKKKIIGNHESLESGEEKEIKGYYEQFTPREKADALYGKVMSYMVDRQAAAARRLESERVDEAASAPESPDPYLISEIRVLTDDPAVFALLAETYGEARVDAKTFRISELGMLWRDTVKEIGEKEKAYQKLERELYLGMIVGAAAISAAKSRIAILAKNLTACEQRKIGIETLSLRDPDNSNERAYPETKENTDVVAQIAFQNLKEYKRQLDSGTKFVWLPSFKKIHQETVSAILNHRWPVLIGEAGSGKSHLANAAAVELTGYPPTEIECESTTGETQLISDTAIDPTSGGSYEEYGPLMRAFTGYDDSRQQRPSVRIGRIARFDESGRLGPKAYSIIKKARQKTPGEDFYGHPMLAGATAIWTSNPVGPRYPDRHAPDPAMRREVAEIAVPYPEMSAQKPELYEFAIAALFDENNHITVAKEELAPAYEKKNIPLEQRTILADGSVVIARDEIIADSADGRHGALWRFCAAIKALQESFVFGNSEMEAYPDTLLRFKEGADDEIEIKPDEEPLTLSSSTVTLGELASWMKGFNERYQKQDAEFHVRSLSEWLNFKIKTYLKQADKADRGKLRALFRHFGFLEGSAHLDTSKAKPVTPKEIGYLSPRVPRPVHIEKKTAKEETKPLGKYETTDVLLENESRVFMGIGECVLPEGAFEVSTETFKPLKVGLGARLRIGNDRFIFSGIVQDENSGENGMPIGRYASEELYRVISPEELQDGLLNEFEYSQKQALPDLEADVQEFLSSSET